MHNPSELLSLLQTTTRHALLILGLGIGLSACISTAGAAGAGGDTWQEEVLLHDGKKIIAERTTVRGGRREVGQKGDYIAQSLRFTLPGSSQIIEWEDTRINGLGNSSFLPMALDVVKGIPYLVANTMGCLAYNQWGRPNPPYVVFKFEANMWQRIPVEALPLEIKTPNLVQSMPDLVAAKEPKRFVTAQRIAEEVAGYREAKFRAILREPMVDGGSSCRVEFTNGKGRWLGADWFSAEPNMASCQKVCESEEFVGETCPCKQFFKGE